MTDSAADQPGFTLTVHNNPNRSLTDRDMQAVIELTAHGIGERLGGGPPEVAEVILVDGSGSMNYPHAKILAARHATKSAINVLRDGTRFAVVAGTGRARMVYPQQNRLVVADRTTKAAAARAVDGLHANGGTAISTWLRLAKSLLAEHPHAVRHALLFTDGRNESESRTELEAALADCAGQFTCDARGIGTNWEPAEVLRIVSALGGQGDAVREYADMTGELAAIMERVMRKQVARVGLRVRAMTGTSVSSVEQVYPTRVDLTDRLVRGADGVVEVDTGSWGDETRQYLLGLAVDPTGKVLEAESVAARVEPVVAGDESLGAARGLVMLCWTEDAQRSVVLDPTVAVVFGQADLQKAIDAGCAALSKQDNATAVAELGRAVRLAHLTDNQENLRRLGRLVVIKNAEQGIVRLREKYELVDLFSAEMGSVMTTRGRIRRAADPTPEQVVEPEPEPAPPPPSKNDPKCRHCGFVAAPGDKFCESCHEPLGNPV